jgi:hypothetical protein
MCGLSLCGWGDCGGVRDCGCVCVSGVGIGVDVSGQCVGDGQPMRILASMCE